jgi:DNA recombination protein RmuC
MAGVHFQTQASFAGVEGRQHRPDVVVNLPQNRHLIIDSKVSMVAWQQFCQEKDGDLTKVALQTHVASLKNHIRDLSSKAYPDLKQLRAPDYTMMFVPIEPALIAALQHDDSLFADALDRNIVLVSNTTLLATMRTVAFLWRQEKQQVNALEIAQSAGALYDKFVAFTEDLRLIGQRIDQAGVSYRDAMNKLSESPRRADTLVGRVERLRELGAKTQKRLAPDLLQEDVES